MLISSPGYLNTFQLEKERKYVYLSSSAIQHGYDFNTTLDNRTVRREKDISPLYTGTVVRVHTALERPI
jgi:hypothetical protein